MYTSVTVSSQIADAIKHLHHEMSYLTCNYKGEIVVKLKHLTFHFRYNT